ncbi:MAG: AMP-binding protein, partial [Thiopseudomonas sp.]|nr:AMP-binding protein [Thiopseudomonas sp.]
PRRWRFIEQLPLNAQGKIIHSQVMDSLQQERPKLPIVKQVTGADFNWQLELKIPHDLAYFSGHFPSAPVLPGVVQVDWALHLAQQHMSLPNDFAGMEVLKFQQLVRPADEVSLSLRFEPRKNKLYFAFTMADTPCSSGRILLAGQHG